MLLGAVRLRVGVVLDEIGDWGVCQLAFPGADNAGPPRPIPVHRSWKTAVGLDGVHDRQRRDLLTRTCSAKPSSRSGAGFRAAGLYRQRRADAAIV